MINTSRHQSYIKVAFCSAGWCLHNSWQLEYSPLQRCCAGCFNKLRWACANLQQHRGLQALQHWRQEGRCPGASKSMLCSFSAQPVPTLYFTPPARYKHNVWLTLRNICLRYTDVVYTHVEGIKSTQVHALNEASCGCVEKVCRWEFLVFSGTFETELTVEEDVAGGSVVFSLVSSSFMRHFEGRWQVRQAYTTPAPSS